MKWLCLLAWLGRFATSWPAGEQSSPANSQASLPGLAQSAAADVLPMCKWRRIGSFVTFWCMASAWLFAMHTFVVLGELSSAYLRGEISKAF